MEMNYLEIINEKNRNEIMLSNQFSNRFGMALSEEDVELILSEKNRTLSEQRRIEFGQTIIPKLIYEFCDSQYINADEYVNTLIRLQDIFYLYKNEMEDMVNDSELLHVMREMYDETCRGDLDFLEDTCLQAFAMSVRSGYKGFEKDDGVGEAYVFDSGAIWHYEFFRAMLERDDA